MKKKVLSALLATTMVASMLVGCGSKAEEPAAEAPAAEAPADDAAEAPADDAAEAPADDAAAADEGKVFNIYCWNEEFKSRVTDHYPGYEEVDGTTGKIGDVTVKWYITPSDDNAYQNNLDETLLKQESAAADDKIDMFLIEADYALKYVDTPYTMNVADLGITDADLANQFQYTKDVVTDSNGNIKGTSWQGCPGVLIYNREIAKDVLGTDEPAKVNEAVKDWDTFVATAAKMQEKGYRMTSSVNDTYRVYSNNVTQKWVSADNKIQIDPNMQKWVEDSKKMVDAGQTATHELWSDDWSKGFYPEGKVFCYFGPAWFVDFSMAADDANSIANKGGWGAVEGPQGFFWGGTWICGATGTDNASLVKDIMLKLTCDKDIMMDIVKDDNDFANNEPAMQEMAATDYTSKVLGGQNPLPMYIAGITKVDLSNQSAYDQGINEAFQESMRGYFDGNATYEEALDAFYKAVVEKYPSLSY